MKILAQLVAEKDYPPEVAGAVLTDVAKLGTEAAILSGERTLPDRRDAIVWHDRASGRGGWTEREKALEDRLRALEASHGTGEHE